MHDEQRGQAEYENLVRVVREARFSDTSALDLSRVPTGNIDRLPPGIERMEHLRSLSLSKAAIRSIAPISALRHLERLDLRNCPNLSDISPLTGLDNLSVLGLYRAGVTRIEVLGTLTGLTSLNLEGCNVTDISALSTLTRLEHLNIANTGVTDISPLASLTSLKTLSLWNLQVDDLTPLKGLVQMEELDLWNTRVSDLSPLAGMAGLVWLDLSHSDVTDISVLSELPNLDPPALWNTPLQSKAPGHPRYSGRWVDRELGAAVLQGDIETVKALVARGAIITTQDWDGPIHKAASAGHLEICRFLVSLDHDLVNELPLYDEVCPDETPLSMALLKGHRDVADFLLENGANVGANETDWDNRWIAPRHMISAALANDLIMIQRLLDLGVPHDARDEDDRTALHWAIAREQPDAARFLFNLWRADQQMEPLAASDITDAMLIEAALLTGATPETLHIMETFWARSLNPWR